MLITSEIIAKRYAMFDMKMRVQGSATHDNPREICIKGSFYCGQGEDDVNETLNLGAWKVFVCA